MSTLNTICTSSFQEKKQWKSLTSICASCYRLNGLLTETEHFEFKIPPVVPWAGRRQTLHSSLFFSVFE